VFVRKVWGCAAFGWIAIGLASTACVRIPNADSAASGPSVDQVVRRIKCDLVKAVRPVLTKEKYTWLQTWTAQANLTFIANDGSTLTPGVTLIAAASSASLGLGAGLNTTASRNETVTFSLSLEEIKDEHQSDPGSRFCNYPDLTDIQSELGLREWIASALSPAKINYLKPGHHKTSKGGGAPSSSGSSSSSGAGGSTTQPSAANYVLLDDRVARYKSLMSASKAELRTRAENQLKTLSLEPSSVENLIRKLQCDAPDQNDNIIVWDCKFQKLLGEIAEREIYDPTTPIAPSVTAITPAAGSPHGGTPVVITGADFTNQTGVSIGGVPVNSLDTRKFKVASDSTICAMTPDVHSFFDTLQKNPSNKAQGDVVVNTPEGAGVKSGAFVFDDSYLVSVQPSFGTAGTDVTITGGNNFSPVQNVFIGGKPAASWQVDSDKPNVIHAKVAAIAPGVVDVIVATSDGKTPKISGPSFFTYFSKDDLPAKPPNDDFEGYCPDQPSSTKKIIAYVDQRLDRKIDKALFLSRQLVNAIEDRLSLRNPPGVFDKTQLNALLQATKSVQDALLALELDPPIDAVGHQVQFVVVYNANISPTWTLVSFKGPTPGSGSLASGTKTLTHTLNIALGPPGSQDVANTLGALQVGTAIGNQLNVNQLSVPAAFPISLVP